MINLKFYLILCGILFLNNKILGQLDITAVMEGKLIFETSSNSNNRNHF